MDVLLLMSGTKKDIQERAKQCAALYKPDSRVMVVGRRRERRNAIAILKKLNIPEEAIIDVPSRTTFDAVQNAKHVLRERSMRDVKRIVFLAHAPYRQKVEFADKSTSHLESPPIEFHTVGPKEKYEEYHAKATGMHERLFEKHPGLYLTKKSTHISPMSAVSSVRHFVYHPFQMVKGVKRSVTKRKKK